MFGQRATISSISVKIEDGELVYKAQMSDGEEVKIYPAKIGEENVIKELSELNIPNDSITTIMKFIAITGNNDEILSSLETSAAQLNFPVILVGL